MNGEEYWRSEVSPRLQALSTAQEQTAIILERIQGQIAVQNNRITSLEGQPGSSRANQNALFQAISTAVAVMSFAVGSLGCLLSPLIAGVIAVGGSLVVWLITSR